MPTLQGEWGSYDVRGMIRIYGSFQANGSTTPDTLRDGNRNSFTVAHTSTGLYTVTLAGNHPLPETLVYESASISVAATLSARAQVAHIVRDSWDQGDRTFQIVIHTVGDVADAAYIDPEVEDPNDNDRINFELIGSISPVGTDAA